MNNNYSQRLLIFGINSLAELLKYYIEKYTNGIISGFILDKEYLDNYPNKIDNIPIICFDNIEKIFPVKEYSILLALGYSNMNELRMEKYDIIKQKGYNIASFVHPTASVQQEFIEEGTIVLENTVIQPFVKMGVCNIFWSNVNISHHTVIGDFNYFAPMCSCCGNVTIGSQCFIGSNCTVKNGVKLADKTLAGAGVYISHDTFEADVIVPQRSITLTNKKSYDML